MYRIIAIVISLLFFVLPCWATQMPCFIYNAPQFEDFGETLLKKNSSLLVSDYKMGKREALPEPMPKPVKENEGALPDPMPEPIGKKKGALPDPMPKPVDTKILPGDPKPQPIGEKRGVLPEPMPMPVKSKSLPGDPKP